MGKWSVKEMAQTNALLIMSFTSHFFNSGRGVTHDFHVTLFQLRSQADAPRRHALQRLVCAISQRSNETYPRNVSNSPHQLQNQHTKSTHRVWFSEGTHQTESTIETSHARARAHTDTVCSDKLTCSLHQTSCCRTQLKANFSLSVDCPDRA